MRAAVIALTSCAVAYAVGAATARPTLGVLAGVIPAVLAGRLWGNHRAGDAAARRAAPAWLVSILSFLPVLALVVIADGINGATDAMPHAGWRAAAVMAVMLAYARGLDALSVPPEEPPPPDLRDTPAAVQREMDAAIRGR